MDLAPPHASSTFLFQSELICWRTSVLSDASWYSRCVCFAKYDESTALTSALNPVASMPFSRCRRAFCLRLSRYGFSLPEIRVLDAAADVSDVVVVAVDSGVWHAASNVSASLVGVGTVGVAVDVDDPCVDAGVEAAAGGDIIGGNLKVRLALFSWNLSHSLLFFTVNVSSFRSSFSLLSVDMVEVASATSPLSACTSDFSCHFSGDGVTEISAGCDTLLVVAR